MGHVCHIWTSLSLCRMMERVCITISVTCLRPNVLPNSRDMIGSLDTSIVSYRPKCFFSSVLKPK